MLMWHVRNLKAGDIILVLLPVTSRLGKLANQAAGLKGEKSVCLNNFIACHCFTPLSLTLHHSAVLAVARWDVIAQCGRAVRQ